MTTEEKIAQLEEQIQRLKLRSLYEDRVINKGFNTRTQEHYFRLCEAFEGGVFTQAKASELLGMTQGGTSLLVKKLIDNGLVSTVRLHSIKPLSEAYRLLIITP